MSSFEEFWEENYIVPPKDANEVHVRHLKNAYTTGRQDERKELINELREWVGENRRHHNNTNEIDTPLCVGENDLLQKLSELDAVANGVATPEEGV
jgi:hypothetical protein